MKKIIFVLLTAFITSNLNAGATDEIGAGYNSNGDKAHLVMELDLIAYIASRGVDKKFIAKFWLDSCAPSNIYKGYVKKTKLIDNDEAMKIHIKNKWKSFGSEWGEMLLIFGEDSYRVKCIDDGRS